MTVELSAIAYSSILLLLLILISAGANVSAMGQSWGFGNRETQPSSDGFKGRTKRAYMNLLEQLVIFSILVITAHLAGIHSSLTVLAAQIFLLGRVVHAIVYLAGLTFVAVRTLAWAVALAGSFIMIYAICTSDTLIIAVPAVM